VAERALVERLFRRAVLSAPEDAEPRGNLALLHSQQGNHQAAENSALLAILLNPAYDNGHNNYARSFKDRARPEGAEASYRRVAALRPAASMGWVNLGDVLKELGRTEEALACTERAVIADPTSAAGWNNRGHLFQGQGRLTLAEAALRRALRLQPGYAAAHLNLGMTLLQAGRFEEGWRHYEWWRATAPLLAGWRPPPEKRWSGQDLKGKTLLLSGEQGLGDVLQFSRYASVFADLGARVLLQVHPPLVRLLASLPGAALTLPMGEAPPEFDYHLPMMSAPAALGTRLETIPAKIPYLTADPELAERWRGRLSGLSGLKVGLVWGGNPRDQDPAARLVDRRRSMALSEFSPLLAISGISFVSLQKGVPAAQVASLPLDLRPFDAMEEVEDFADTAALIANLDLVISVDTSVAHLAGALGKPVWILSRFDGCWRWLQDRDDSPWYPTARLFRQRSPGDWAEVVARVREALAIQAS
ncbi:MAG TPA: tetratricopeptide repeat protein, partial [Magnetospirillaceae bacterium]|nr:tetratricopeptide repeat protein [Magnetospirillaceae bacterium]